MTFLMLIDSLWEMIQQVALDARLRTIQRQCGGCTTYKLDTSTYEILNHAVLAELVNLLHIELHSYISCIVQWAMVRRLGVCGD
jgi:hypothetical protein